MIGPMATVDTAAPVARPPQMSDNPARRVVDDLRAEWRGRGRFPPGPGNFSLARTHQIATDPLPLLLSSYERYGPIFSLRLLHTRVVFMLGPEANNFVTVAHPENFHWRESSFGDLIPLLGDGLLTIDDGYHDRARAIMMPAFHRRQLDASVAAMSAEADTAIAALRPDTVVDVYDWMRNLAMRIAMRALLGLDPDESGKGAAAAEHFERALGFYGIDYPLRLLRGPGSPWRKLLASRKVLDEIVFGEIERRRAAPDGGRQDILSLLLGARGEAGEAFTDREVRDQVMTLMFAGHDTSTSTLSFMMLELARHPEVADRLREEQERVLGGEPPTVDRLEKEMPYLDMVLDEVLRLYPSSAATRCRAAPTSTTAPGPATASPRSSPSRRRSSPSASRRSARRRCRAAPTSPSAAAAGSASASASARPR
jgi:cytochrome P450